eukprot:scaffold2212_cov143-Cylindrotheca_fusiformis.AAC.20
MEMDQTPRMVEEGDKSMNGVGSTTTKGASEIVSFNIELRHQWQLIKGSLGHILMAFDMGEGGLDPSLTEIHDRLMNQIIVRRQRKIGEGKVKGPGLGHLSNQTEVIRNQGEAPIWSGRTVATKVKKKEGKRHKPIPFSAIRGSLGSKRRASTCCHPKPFGISNEPTEGHATMALRSITNPNALEGRGELWARGIQQLNEFGHRNANVEVLQQLLNRKWKRFEVTVERRELVTEGKVRGNRSESRSNAPSYRDAFKNGRASVHVAGQNGNTSGGRMPRFRRSSRQKDINSRRRHAQTHVEEERRLSDGSISTIDTLRCMIKVAGPLSTKVAARYCPRAQRLELKMLLKKITKMSPNFPGAVRRTGLIRRTIRANRTQRPQLTTDKAWIHMTSKLLRQHNIRRSHSLEKQPTIIDGLEFTSGVGIRRDCEFHEINVVFTLAWGNKGGIHFDDSINTSQVLPETL